MKQCWQRRRRWLLGAAGVMTLTACILAALWATNAFGWRAFRLMDAEAFIGAPLPTEAVNMQFASRSTYGRIVWLRFEVNGADAAASFVATLGLTAQLQPGFTPFPQPNPQEAEMTWWTPHGATVFRGVYENTGQKIIEVLVDESAPAQTRVFVRAYTLHS